MGSRIYQWDPEVGGDWRRIADLEDDGITVSRIAVSPDGSTIAIVGHPLPEIEPEMELPVTPEVTPDVVLDVVPQGAP
jgi:hypothetical protein